MRNYIKKLKLKVKRHFQLLELMVATFILLLCVAPTMRMFTSMHLSQQATIRENYRDHIAQMAHAIFTEQLYKRLIPLAELKESKPIRIADPDLSKLLEQYGYHCSGVFSIENTHQHKGDQTPYEYLCKLEIKIKDLVLRNRKQGNPAKEEITYTYLLFIDASGSNKTSPPEDDDDEDDEEDDDEDGDEDDDDDEDDEDEF